MAVKRTTRGFEKVKLGKKDYLVPANKPFQLMRITSHPTAPGMFLVWRQEKGPSHFNIYVNEAVKGKQKLEERTEVANLFSSIRGNRAAVQDFEVDTRLFGKTLRVALREALIRELRNRAVEEVSFPPYRFEKFYEAAGIKKVEPPFVGYEGKLGEYKSKAKKIALKVVWQKPVPASKRPAKGKRLQKMVRMVDGDFI